MLEKSPEPVLLAHHLHVLVVLNDFLRIPLAFPFSWVRPLALDLQASSRALESFGILSLSRRPKSIEKDLEKITEKKTREKVPRSRLSC